MADQQQYTGYYDSQGTGQSEYTDETQGGGQGTYGADAYDSYAPPAPVDTVVNSGPYGSYSNQDVAVNLDMAYGGTTANDFSGPPVSAYQSMGGLSSVPPAQEYAAPAPDFISGSYMGSGGESLRPYTPPNTMPSLSFGGSIFTPPISTSGPQMSTPRNKGDFYSNTQNWVQAKGYGWLMEIDDDDEEDQRPLLEELDIDFMDILSKIRSVLLPYKLRPRDDQLTAPDFWGPFFIVLLYAFLLLWGQFKAVSWVFTLWLIGSFVVYFLSKVLGGGEGGLAEVLAVTGYSLIPLVLLCLELIFVHKRSTMALSLKVLHVLWCAYAAKTLLVTDSLQHKQCMIAYPILLLYTYFVSLHSGV